MGQWYHLLGILHHALAILGMVCKWVCAHRSKDAHDNTGKE